MKSKKRERQPSVDDQPKNAQAQFEPIQSERDLFIQSYEKPTQIYRFLKTRNAISPIFLQRTLSYMSGRCARKLNTRSAFRVYDMLGKAERDYSKRLTHFYRSEFLNISFLGFYDDDVNPLRCVDCDVYLMKIYHKKRKDSSSILPVHVGMVSVPLNPQTADKSDQTEVGDTRHVVSVSSERFADTSLSRTSPKSYVLVLRVLGRRRKAGRNGCSLSPPGKRLSNASDSENQHPPKKRLRSSREFPSRLSDYDTSSCGRGSDQMSVDSMSSLSDSGDSESIIYTAHLDVYDRHRRCLLTDGVYVLQMNPEDTGEEVVRKGGKEMGFKVSNHRQKTWETVADGEISAESPLPLELFTKSPQIKFSLDWSKVALQKEPNGAPLSTCEVLAQNNNTLYEIKRGRPRSQVHGGLTHSVLTKNHTPQSSVPAKRSRIFYQFLFNNNTQRQQTEAPTEMRCPFCSLHCPRLHALLSHLRYCHSRFNFTYTEHPKGARIDVSINEFYDGSYVGNPQDLQSHVGFAFSRNGPVQRLPVTQVIVARPKKRTFDLAEFLEPESDGSKNRQLVMGHNRLYYHTSTCQPVRPCDIDLNSEDEIDPEWLRQKTQKMIEEFSDVNEGEKEVMKMWNLHVMHHNFIGDCQMPSACTTFVEEYGSRIARQNLSRNFLLHLVNLCDFGLIRPEVVYRAAVQYLRLSRELEGTPEQSDEGTIKQMEDGTSKQTEGGTSKETEEGTSKKSTRGAERQGSVDKHNVLRSESSVESATSSPSTVP